MTTITELNDKQESLWQEFQRLQRIADEARTEWSMVYREHQNAMQREQLKSEIRAEMEKGKA
jgi:hypothetical protein